MFISHTTTHVKCVNYNTQIFQSVSFLLVYCLLLYIQLTISFLIGRKRTVNFRNQRLGRHLAADYTITHSLLTIIMSRTLKVTGNHVMSRAIMVMYDRGAWFLRVIMSSSRALCCLPSVKKQIRDFQVCFVDRARHRKSSWRQGLKNTKRSTKVAKELFADYVKEKNWENLTKTKSWHKLWKHSSRSEKKRIRSIMYNKAIIIDSVSVISRIIKVSIRVISISRTPTSTLIILDITKP